MVAVFKTLTLLISTLYIASGLPTKNEDLFELSVVHFNDFHARYVIGITQSFVITLVFTFLVNLCIYVHL